MKGSAKPLGGIDEAAGVHDHQIGAAMAFGQFIALGAQRGDDTLGIDQRFRAAERNEGNAGRGRRRERRGVVEGGVHPRAIDRTGPERKGAAGKSGGAGLQRNI